MYPTVSLFLDNVFLEFSLYKLQHYYAIYCSAGHSFDLILKDNIKTVRGSYVACIFSCWPL